MSDSKIYAMLQNISLYIVKHDSDSIINDCDSEIYSSVMCYYFIALYLLATNKR